MTGTGSSFVLKRRVSAVIFVTLKQHTSVAFEARLSSRA